MKVRIDRNIALVCFVHNLANWHISCTPSFSTAWSSWPQPLSTEEKVALDHLSRLFKDYLNQNEELWIKELFIANQKATVPVSDLSYFDVFVPRFDYFYRKQKENMRLVSRYLEGLESKFMPHLLSTRSLYGFDEGADVSAYLTLSANANKQASGMLLEIDEQNRYFVVMEYGDYRLSEDNWTIDNVYLHELAHVFQCSEKFKNLIELAAININGQDRLERIGITTEDMLTEIIHAGLWGECGFFSRRIFGDKLNEALDRKGDWYKLMVENVATTIQPLVSGYINSGRTIDGLFADTVVKEFNIALTQTYDRYKQD